MIMVIPKPNSMLLWYFRQEGVFAFVDIKSIAFSF